MSDLTNRVNLDALMPKENERADATLAQFRLALAMDFGDRMPEILIPDLEACFLNQPEVFRFLVTDEKDEFDPQDMGTVRRLARQTVKDHTFASRALAFQDEKKKTELRERFVMRLSPAKRIAMARAGTLEEAAETYVRDQLEAGATKC